MIKVSNTSPQVLSPTASDPIHKEVREARVTHDGTILSSLKHANDYDYNQLDDKIDALSATSSTSLSVLQVAVDSLDTRLDVAEPKITTLQADAVSLDGRLDAAEPKITTLQSDMTAEKAKIAGLQADNTTNKANIATLQTSVSYIEQARVKQYGYRRMYGGTSPILERLGDAVGKVSNVSYDDATTVDDFAWMDNLVRDVKIDSLGRRWYPSETGYASLTDCDYMVEMQRFYVKRVATATYLEEWVCLEPKAGYVPHELFKNHTTGGYYNSVDIAKYKTSVVATKDVSRPNQYPSNFRDLASFRVGAQSKGVGWQQIDNSYVDAIRLLYMIRYAHLNSELTFPNNYTNFRYTASDTAVIAESATNRIVVTNAVASYFNVGESIRIGTSLGGTLIADARIITAINTYDASNKAIVFDGASVNIAIGNIIWHGTQPTGGTSSLTKMTVMKNSGVVAKRASFKFLGIEDIFGNVYEWIDGQLINDWQTYIVNNPSKFASTITADYKPTSYVNKNSDGYVMDFGFDEEFPHVKNPTNVGAGSTTGYCDYYYQYGGLRASSFGGYALTTANFGLFFCNSVNAPSHANWNLGSRLMRKGD